MKNKNKTALTATANAAAWSRADIPKIKKEPRRRTTASADTHKSEIRGPSVVDNAITPPVLDTGRGRRGATDVEREIDINIGKRIRERRTMLGLSQSRLADALKIAFQQVQKYERGINRVPVSRLTRIADILDVHITFFLDSGDGGSLPPIEKPANRVTLELHRHYVNLPKTQQRIVLDLVKALVANRYVV